MTDSDIEKHKVVAIIGYIVPLLFFIPLVTDAKDSAYAKFHANQHLLLLISGISLNIFGFLIPIIGWFIIIPFGWIALLVLAIMGIINASRGEMKPLPVIGGIEILK